MTTVIERNDNTSIRIVRIAWIAICALLRLAVAGLYLVIILLYFPYSLLGVLNGYDTDFPLMIFWLIVHAAGASAIVWSTWRLARGKDHDSAGIATFCIILSLGIAVVLPGAYTLRLDRYEENTTRKLAALRQALAERPARDKSAELPRDFIQKALLKPIGPKDPEAEIPYFHPRSSNIRYGATEDDSGGWIYNNVAGTPKFGQLWVNCTHERLRGDGKVWSEY